MTRKNRNILLFNGCFAHIISRSIREEKVFKQNDDVYYFLNLLKKAKEKYAFNLFHYCLMQTHFHFVVQILSMNNLAKALNYLKCRYVFYYHKKYKFSGPIWRERYRSLLIENLEYLNACGQYVEYNPVKAGIVKDIEDWEFSSAKHYLGKGRDFLLESYEIPEIKNKVDYKKSEEFEEGDGIGGDVFKFKLRRDIK